MSLLSIEQPGSFAAEHRRSHAQRREADRRNERWSVLFWTACGAVTAIRLLVFISAAAPPGVDPGNWLANGHLLARQGPWSGRLVYPPLVPALTVAFQARLAETVGIALLAALCAAAPAIAVRHVMLTHANQPTATAAGLAMLTAVSIGEQAAWGAFPQLLGLALVVVALAVFDRCLRSQVGVIPTSGALAAVAYTSHLETLLLAFAATILFVTHLGLAANHRIIVRRAGACLALTSLVAAPLAGIYGRLTAAVAAIQHASPALTRLNEGDLVSRFADTFPHSSLIWELAIIGAIIVPLLCLQHRRQPIWTIHVALTSGVLASLVVTREPRYLYDLAVPATLSLGLWSTLAPPTTAMRHFINGSVTAAVMTIAVTGMLAVCAQHDQYQVLDRSMLSGLHWIRQHTPKDAEFAVSPLHNRPLGWWVQGIARRPTFTAAPLRWLTLSEERQRARIANTIFLPGEPDPQHRVTLAVSHGIRYLAYTRHDTWFAAPCVHAVVTRCRVVFQNSALVIVDLAQTCRQTS